MDLKAHYLEPCTCWRNAPEEHKQWWWRAFQTRYYWAEELNDRVYNDWVKKAGERLKDIVSKAMTRPDNEIIPWLPTPLRSRLKAFRETEDFKKRSRQNSINKRTGPKAGTVHTAGSISAEQTPKKMVIRDNKIPTAAELFEQIHTRKEGNEKVFCDKRAKSIWDEYQRLKLDASNLGVEVNNDELFLQAARGVNSKGLVYGLGNQTQAYYERVGPSTQSSASTPTTYTPSMYAQIVSRLQKSKEQLNATREELTRTKEEVKQTKDAIARIESHFGSSSS